MIDVPVLVKDALRDGRRLKNYKIKVYGTGADADVVDFTIDNATLVTESVKFDERMCSGDVLKFGLCEGTSLEFQYFDHPSINGRRIYVEIDVQYEDNGSLSWYTIPMGFFTVSQCPMQYSTGIYKVTAYNKLKSSYLDTKANDMIKEIVSKGVAGVTDGNIDISIILEQLLNDYSIESNYNYVMNPGSWAFEEIKSAVLSPSPLNVAGIDIHAYGVLYGTVYLAQYPTYSWPVSPMFPYPDRWNGQSTWYQDGYFRLSCNMKTIYDTMLSYVPSEMLDIEMYSTDGDRQHKYTIQDWLMGKGSTALEKNVTMVARLRAANNVSTALSTTPENYQSAEANGDLVTNLGYPSIGHTIRIDVPLLWKDLGTITWDGSSLPQWTAEEQAIAENRLKSLMFSSSWGVYSLNIDVMQVQQRLDPVSGFYINQNDVDDLPDVTLRQLQAALFEVLCQYGQINRVTDLFYGKELETQALYPADTLYPDDALYPGGTRESGFRAQYSKLWTDTQGVKSFRNLIIKYKTLDGDNKEVDATLTVEVNADGTTDYNMDDNWVFKNLIWTAQQIEVYADAMVAKMQGLKWFPFEMWSAGLPYIETGDEIEIILDQNTFTTYVLQRQLSGIQNLQDTYINGTLDIF